MWRAKRWEDLEKYFTSGDVFTDTTYPQTTRYEKNIRHGPGSTNCM